jgi:hypothetical protein
MDAVMDRVVLLLNPGKCGSTWLSQALHLPPHLSMPGELDFLLFLAAPLDGQWNRTTLDDRRCQALRASDRMSEDDKLSALYRLRLPYRGKLLDKSPSNLEHVERFARLYRGSPIVLFYRDPRDIYVSKERFHQDVLRRKARVEDLGDPAYLASPDCLLEDVFALSRKLAAVERRLRSQGYKCYRMRYEDLIARFMPTMEGLLGFLGIPADDPLVRAHVAEIETARVPMFRKGGTGDWKNHLATPEARRIVRERFGQDLVDLGYEETTDG